MNHCLYCQAIINESNHFCLKHWCFLDGKLKGPLVNATKPETIEKYLNLAIECLKIKESKYLLGPNTLYYAHPMSFYNTKLEEETLIILTQEFPEFKVLNPAEARYQGQNMKFYQNLVAQCQKLIVQPFPDGKISAGVFLEIETAKRFNIPIQMIQNKQIKNLPEQFPILSIEETLKYYKKF